MMTIGPPGLQTRFYFFNKFFRIGDTEATYIATTQSKEFVGKSRALSVHKQKIFNILEALPR